MSATAAPTSTPSTTTDETAAPDPRTSLRDAVAEALLGPPQERQNAPSGPPTADPDDVRAPFVRYLATLPTEQRLGAVALTTAIAAGTLGPLGVLAALTDRVGVYLLLLAATAAVLLLPRTVDLAPLRHAAVAAADRLQPLRDAVRASVVGAIEEVRSRPAAGHAEARTHPEVR